MEQQDLVNLTADVVAAHVANNNVALGELELLIRSVHGALVRLQEPPPPPEPEGKRPIVSARASVKPDYLVCMECGKRQKTLKRHLSTAHGLTPQQYRADYGLPATYQMIAPSYAEKRRALAHAIGLGRKAKTGRPKDPAKGSGRGRRAAAPRGTKA